MDDPFYNLSAGKKWIWRYWSYSKLTDELIFCPKCGAKNSFKISEYDIKLKYFCQRCSERLNDIWEDYQRGQIDETICKYCQQLTFNSFKYCIACGLKQKKVAKKRFKELSTTKEVNILEEAKEDREKLEELGYDPSCNSGIESICYFFGLKH